MTSLLALSLGAFFLTSGSGGDSLKQGYAILTPDESRPVPAATALFSLENEGTLSSEAAVDATRTLHRGRLFVDQRDTLTGLALANPGEADLTVSLTLRNAAGDSAGFAQITLRAGHQIAQFVDEIFTGLPEGFIGSLTFETQDGSSGVAAVTIRQSLGGRGQPLFATLPVVDLDQPAESFQAGEDGIVFPHIGAGGPLTTQIVLINPTSQAVRGTIELTASDGSDLAVDVAGANVSRASFQLPPNGVHSVTLGSPEDIVQGYARVTVEPGHDLPGGTAVFQFRDPRGGLISEAGVGPSMATQQARIFVDLVGTQTGMALAGPAGAEPVELTFLLSTRAGALIDRATRTLPASGHLAFFADDLFPFLPESFTGTLEVASPEPVVPITLKLTFNTLGDPILTTLPVADLQNSADSGGSLIFPQIGSGSGFSTRLLLLSDGAEQAALGELAFFDFRAQSLDFLSAGQSNDRFPYRIEAGGSRQFRLDDPATPSRIFLDPVDPAVTEIVVNQGNQVSLSPWVVDSQGKARDDFSFSYLSLDTEVATIDSNGRIDGLEAGFSSLAVETDGVLAAGTLSVVSVQSGAGGFQVEGVSQDLASRLYLLSPQDHTVLLASGPGAAPQVYAGVKGEAGLRNGLRDDSLFDGPVHAAVNQASGELLVSDRANNVIRAVGPGAAGTVHTLAGSGEPGHRDGAALDSRFRQPEGVALDRDGNLWVADSGNHVIRRVNLVDGTVETIAGSPGSAGSADGTAGAARFNAPSGVAFEPEPLAAQLERQLQEQPPPPVSVLVADTGNGLIRRVFEDGRVETVSAPTTAAPAAEASMRLQSPAQGVAPVRFEQPVGVAGDPFGRIYVTEPSRNRALVLLPDGSRAPLVQSGSLNNPRGLAVTQGGEVVVTVSDQLSQTVSYGPPELFSIENEPAGNDRTRVILNGRNFAPDTLPVVPGVVVEDVVVRDSSTVSFLSSRPGNRPFATLSAVNRAGVSQIWVEVGADGSIGNAFGFARWDSRDLALDSRGNLTVLNAIGLHQFISGSQAQTLIAGTQPLGATDRITPLEDAFGVDSDSAGRIYLADAGRAQILRIDAVSQTAAVIAGSGAVGFAGDGGPAVQASLNRPQDVLLDSTGNVYVVDTANHRIRRVDAISGAITTVAGNGNPDFGGDGASALDASLNSPAGLAIDAQGNLFIADTGNHRVRKVDALTGTISTVAGDGTAEDQGDGGPAREASLETPTGIALDFDGNLYIGTIDRIRRVDAATGQIDTVAGGGESFLVDVPLPATDIMLGGPNRVILDAAQNLYIIAVGTFGEIVKVNSVTGLANSIAFDPAISG